MLFLRYSGRSVNKDHVRYLKAHRKVGFFMDSISLRVCLEVKEKPKE